MAAVRRIHVYFNESQRFVTVKLTPIGVVDFIKEVEDRKFIFVPTDTLSVWLNTALIRQLFVEAVDE